MQPKPTTYKARTYFLFGFIAMTVSTQIAYGASLFGDHTCQNWATLSYGEKRTWTNAFLAPLSLTLRGLNKSKQDKYNDDPKAYEAAIMSIDKFCMNHPDLNAPDGAVHYLKNLFNTPSNDG